MGRRGQATVEWIALAALVALVLAGAAVAVDGAPLARRIACAIGQSCERVAFEARYGVAIAAAARRHAPGITYEAGEASQPVDYRRCTQRGCSDGLYETPTAFVNVIDRRGDGDGLFLQYWLYYPDSVMYLADRLPVGRHTGDWESYQVRVDAEGRTWARASGHAGYAGRKRLIAPCEAPNKLGIVRPLARMLVGSCDAWAPATGWLRVSRGSHAGHLVDGPRGGERRTPAAALTLVAIADVADGDCTPRGGTIAPPWCKRVYRDPLRDDT